MDNDRRDPHADDPAARPATGSSLVSGAPWNLILAGLAIRAALAAFTIGTTDVVLWHHFGKLAASGDFADAWSRSPILNHPPLPLAWAMLCRGIAGDGLHAFAILLKLPAILADAVSTLAIWHVVAGRAGDRAGRFAAAGFAFSPAAILIAGYHGNLDSAMAALALVAAACAAAGRFGLAGLALGAAINVKLVPAPTVALLLALAPTWRAAARAIAGLAVAALPFAAVLLASGGPFVRNVLAYRPEWRPWLFDVVYAAPSLAATLRPLEALYVRTTYVVLAAILAVLAALAAFRRPRPDAVLIFATFWTAFVAWNGSAFQYAIWPLPLLAAVRPRWAIAYGLFAGAWLAVSYESVLDPTSPWPFSDFLHADGRRGRWMSLLPLGCLAGATASMSVELFRRPVTAEGDRR